MRMRQLGQGQSVVFCVSNEIALKIRGLPNRQGQSSPNNPITVGDVLEWSIVETWQDTKRSWAQWRVQGNRYEMQKHLRSGFQLDIKGAIPSQESAAAFLEDESQSVRARYHPKAATREDPYEHLSKACASLSHDRLGLEDLGLDQEIEIQAALQEQQERELSPEAEREYQIEKPKPAEPLPHTVHEHMRELVLLGKVYTNSSAYTPVFESLHHTSASELAKHAPFRRTDLRVTRDFASTIKINPLSDVMDVYLRPVQWILRRYSKHHDVFFIISPFEVQSLFYSISNSAHVSLHLYAPRPNLSYQPLDSLDLYTSGFKDGAEAAIPESIKIQLNLFSGQLYVDSLEEYNKIRGFIGIAPPSDSDQIETNPDASVSKTQREASTELQAKIIDALKVLMMKIRRNCKTIDKTHLGKLLDKKIMGPEDFEANSV